MIAWLVETLIASTVLMLLVLAVRQPVAHAFGPRIAYALWLLPALRMILPPLPAPVVASAPVTPLPGYVSGVVIDVAERTAPHAAAAAFDWVSTLAFVWLAGVAATAALFLLAYRRLSARIHRDGIVTGTRDGVPILISPAVDGPLAIGIFRPAIVLPTDHADRYSAGELDLAIGHEAAHHARRDLAVNAVALVVRALHWFNPIAAIAHRAFRADQEMACDARVLAQRSSADRCLYANALVKTACGHRLGAAAAMSGVGPLKRRVKMIGRNAPSGTKLVAGFALVALLGGASLGLTASAGVAAERIVHEVKARGPMIALGGVALATQPDDRETWQTRDNDVAERRAATADRAAARARAEAARADAESARTMAEADRADAEARRAAAEADRAARDAARDANAAVRRGLRANVSCSTGDRRIDVPGRETPMVICVPDAKAIRAEVIASLRATRASMARDPMVIDVRAKVLKALDEAIAEIEAERS